MLLHMIVVDSKNNAIQVRGNLGVVIARPAARHTIQLRVLVPVQRVAEGGTVFGVVA
jgi:hypothetical protein